jgi:vitamin B12 transporter
VIKVFPVNIYNSFLRLTKIRRELVILACFTTSIHAQTSVQTEQPETLTPIIVTATVEATSGRDVLSDYDYIGPEQIERAGQTSLPELLQQQRGVQIQTYGGSGNLASVNLRGTNNNQALVLIDGVRVESSAIGGAMWSTLPLPLIDHIEIIFGPQSTFYGADAMGGVIQIFTKRGDGPAQLQASTGYGSYGTSISTASVSGSSEGTDKVRYAFGINNDTSSGFNTVAPNNPCSAANASKNYCAPGYPTSNTGYTRNSATGQISKDWGIGQEFGFKMLASRDSYQYPSYSYDFGVPETGTQIGSTYVASLYSKNQITEYWQSLFQISQSTNYAQSFVTGAADPISTPQTDFLWQNNIKLGPDVLQLSAERRNQFVNATYSPVNSGLPYETSVNQTRTFDSVAATYQLKRGANLATAAIRNDNISGYGSQTTGSVAYGYFFTEELRFNANYGTGFRAPSFNDLYYPGYGNANLLPETNRNMEVGLHYETTKYGIHLVGYDNKIDNLIVPLMCSNQSSGYCPTNFAKTEITGMSFGVNTVIDKVTLQGSYDLMNAVDLDTGNQLPGRAKNVFNFGADYKTGPVNMGTNVTLTSTRWGNAANTQEMSGFALMNLYASYAFDKNWSVFMRWNNIFNSSYQLAYGYNTPGSNVFAGVRYALQ